jgi:uncharacterized membrane protein
MTKDNNAKLHRSYMSAKEQKEQRQQKENVKCTLLLLLILGSFLFMAAIDSLL